jgi:hypothetical protein
MAQQQCGEGKNDAAVHAGMLDLAVSPIHARWTKLEEEISLEEILLGDQIELEKRITLGRPKSTTVEGHVGLSIQGDMRWDHQNSDHAYNSGLGGSRLISS